MYWFVCHIFLRNVPKRVKHIVRTVLGAVSIAEMVFVRVVIVTPSVHFVKRLNNDVTKPNADVCAAHMHQAKTSKGLVTMNAYLFVKTELNK